MGRYTSTEGERYLDALRKTLNFTTWIHGHYHFEYRWDSMFDSRMVGLYYNVVSENDLKEMF